MKVIKIAVLASAVILTGCGGGGTASIPTMPAPAVITAPTLPAPVVFWKLQ